ncbi:MAG: pyridoxal-phosphate dependent enzyme [Herpetosiphonaceae bacterium]|nr:pyridoxal-phosphate dependent enzyme [Herpetosiphonaceae bacterium]
MVTLVDIEQARERLRGRIVRTPLVPFPHELLWLKAENLQPTGAFKLRGAFNKILSLTPDERARGVVAHSSGNHAQAVAYAAQVLGVRAVIVMPQNAPPVKLAMTRSWGAEIVLVGNGSDERAAKSQELAAQHGYTLVPPYADLAIIAGAGTIGLEILEEIPDVEVVTVPVSGGGLLAGVAAALKLARPEVRVIGVEPELAADAYESWRTGQPVTLSAEEVSRTLADGLRVQHVGALNWEHMRAFVDDIVTVSEEEIQEAMRQIAFRGRLVAEPSGAVAIAAPLFHRSSLGGGERTVAILSGGNIEPALLTTILRGAAIHS